MLKHYLVSAHGNQCVCKKTTTINLPLNVMVVMNCNNGEVHSDINYDTRIWQFATSEVLKRMNTNVCVLENFVEYKKLLGELDDIVVVADDYGKDVNYENKFCVYTSQCPNIEFDYGAEFITGAYELPVQASISKGSSSYDMASSVFDKYIDFPYGKYDEQDNYKWNTVDPEDEDGLDKYFDDKDVTIENSELKRIRNFLYPVYRETGVNIVINVPEGGYSGGLPKDLATMITDIKSHYGETFNDKFHVILVHACTCGGNFNFNRQPVSNYAEGVYKMFCDKFPRWMNKQLGGKFRVTKRGTYYEKSKVGIEKRKLVIIDKVSNG
jgi:hypothetical protein